MQHFINMDPSLMQATIRPIRKPKRFRSAFTTEQIKFLEVQFKKFPYISSEHRKEIATALKMQERAVKIWFQNRRMKEKKESTNKEPDLETTDKAEESDRLNNAHTLPSTNSHLAYSLPSAVNPIVISKYFAGANNGIRNERSENFEAQDAPQNLSMNHMKLPNHHQTCSVENQAPFFCGLTSTQNELTRKQIKNRNPPIQRKPVEVSMDLSKRLKKVKREISQDHKLKMQRKLELHSSISVKSRDSIEQMPSKRKTLPTSRLSKQSKSNEAAYLPVMPTVYAHPYISSGGVIWKPINIMPVVTPGNALPVSSNQNFGHSQNNNCGCNCHGNAMTSFSNVTNPYAQYVFTAPTPYQS